jgi:RTX calcium-binding nonapeptide repeat (4 copies)
MSGRRATSNKERRSKQVPESTSKISHEKAARRRRTQSRQPDSPCFDVLEERRLLALDVPWLSSLPGAPVTIHLDFDGTPAFLFNEDDDIWASGPLAGDNDPIPAFSLDNDFLNFSDPEINAINQIWQEVSEKYAPFDINVTTNPNQVPVGYPNGAAVHAIMGGMNSDWGQRDSSTLGVAFENAFTNDRPNSAFVFTGTIVARRNNGEPAIKPETRHQIAGVAAHEVGHTFGLKHQSTVDGNNNVIVEYSDGDSNTAPIMGGSALIANMNKRGLWWKGPSSERDGDDLEYTGIQDDLLTLLRPGNYVVSRNHSGTLTVDTATGTASGYGVIDTNGDVDDMGFNSIGSVVSFEVKNAQFGGMLTPTLELFPLGGSAPGSVTVTNSATSATLTATGLTPGGGYLLRVKAQDGQYGNLGQYFITGNVGAFATLASGVLTVDGFETDNDLAISYHSSTDKIVLQNNIQGAASIQQFPRSQVSQIVVEFLNGHDDTISVFGQFSVLNIPIQIRAGSSIDNDKVSLQGTSGNDYLALHSDSSAQINNTPITLAKGLLANLVEIRMSGFDGDDVFDITECEDPLVILANAHNDTINLGTGPNDFAKITAPVFVYGDSGSDTLNLGNGNASAITVDITFDGGVGGGGVVDTVNYNDGSNISTVEYKVDYNVFSATPRTVERNGFGSNWTLFYNNVSEFNVYAGGGNDFFTVGSDVAEIVRCYGNSGNDYMVYGDGVLGPLSGQLFNGGLGEDTLVLDDHLDSVGRTWDVFNNRVTFAGLFVFSTAGFEDVQILAGNGGDTIWFSNQTFSQSYTVDGGGNYDDVFINGARIASLTARGGSGGDRLSIDDRNFPGNVTGGEVYTDRINRSIFTGGGFLNFDINYSQFNAVDWYLPLQQNVVNVWGVSPDIDAASAFFINGNDSDDYVTVYPRDASGNLTLAGNVYFTGGGGTANVDELWIVDQGPSTPTGATYRVHNGISANAATIDIGSRWVSATSSTDAIRLHGSAGPDTFDIDHYSSGSALYIHGRDGDDSVTIGNGSLAANLTNAAAFAFDGGNDNDRFTVANGLSGSSWAYNILEGSLIATISGVYSWTSQLLDIERQTMLGGPADDFFNVFAVADGVLTECIGGGGYDGLGIGFSGLNLTLDSIRGPVVFNAGAGGGRAYIDDAGDTTGDVVHMTNSTLGSFVGDTLFGPGGSLSFSDLTNSGVLSGFTLNTGSGEDVIFAQPLATTRVDINAGNPVDPPGDSLALALSSAVNPVISGGSSGNVTSSNLQTLAWTGIEQPISIDDVAPQVIASSFDESAGSRLIFRFGEDVSQSLSTASLILVNTSTGQQLVSGVMNLAYETATHTARFTFPAFPDGLLPSGTYTASLASTVADAFGNPLAASAPLQFSVVRTVAWIAAGDGMWNDPANWAGGQVPLANDAVEINNPNAQVTITIPAGNYAVARLVSHESLVIAQGATFAIGGQVEFNSATLTNRGLFSMGTAGSPTRLLLVNDATFFNMPTGTTNGWGNLVPGDFNIGGSSAGSFINNGLLYVHGGSFEIGTSGSSYGTFQVAGGAAVSFSNGYLLDNGTSFNGGGLVQFQSPADPARILGDVNFTNVSAENSGRFELGSLGTAGSIVLGDGVNFSNLPTGNMGGWGNPFPGGFNIGGNGTGSFVNNGLLFVHEGSFAIAIGGSGNGTYQVANGAAVTIGGNRHTFGDGTEFTGEKGGSGVVQFTSNECRFEGVVTMFGIEAYNVCLIGGWSDGGSILFGGGATLFNEAGSGLTIGPTSTFVSITGDGQFINNGMVDVQGGTFVLGKGSGDGTFDVAKNATLQFDGGFSLNDGTRITGEGNVLVQPLVPPNPIMPNPVHINGMVETQGITVGSAGVLEVSGSLTVASALNVLAAGTVSGSGIIDGNVMNAGLILPGTSPGTLTIDGDFTQSAGGALRMELGGTKNGMFDQIRVLGAVNLAGILEIRFVNNYKSSAGDQFVIIGAESNGAVNGTFAGMPEGSVVSVGGRRFHVSYIGGNGNDVMLTDVSTAALVPDAVQPGKLALLVLGTSGNDDIKIKPFKGSQSVEVVVNGTSYGGFAPTGRIIVRAGSGNDDVSVADSVSRSTWIDGEEGNDVIKGGAGHNVLLGGTGIDFITGGNGRDLIIGGSGADRVVGGGSDDLLIAGTTAFDSSEAALFGIHNEWNSTRTYAERVTNLRGTGSGPAFNSRLNGNYFLVVDGPNRTMFDDGENDRLTGSKGVDWFFANLDGSVIDQFTDLIAGELVDDLD